MLCLSTFLLLPHGIASTASLHCSSAAHLAVSWDSYLSAPKIPQLELTDFGVSCVVFFLDLMGASLSILIKEGEGIIKGMVLDWMDKTSSWTVIQEFHSAGETHGLHMAGAAERGPYSLLLKTEAALAIAGATEAIRKL